MILPFVPYYKLVAAGAVVLALAGTHWKAYTVGKKGEQAKAVALQLKQTNELANFNENQRLIERGWQAQTTKAQNDRIVKFKAAQPVAIAIRSELDGLRGNINTIDTNASREPASACIVRAATARNLFEQCTQKYTEVAKSADGHAADSVMLQDSWPK